MRPHQESVVRRASCARVVVEDDLEFAGHFVKDGNRNKL
jgi:hypothetical protein